MTDFETIGQAINSGLQSGAIANCGHSDGGGFEILEPSGDGWRFYFQFDKPTGAAMNISAEEMKAALAAKGVEL